MTVTAPRQRWFIYNTAFNEVYADSDFCFRSGGNPIPRWGCGFSRPEDTREVFLVHCDHLIPGFWDGPEGSLADQGRYTLLGTDGLPDPEAPRVGSPRAMGWSWDLVCLVFGTREGQNTGPVPRWAGLLPDGQWVDEIARGGIVHTPYSASFETADRVPADAERIPVFDYAGDAGERRTYPNYYREHEGEERVLYCPPDDTRRLSRFFDNAPRGWQRCLTRLPVPNTRSLPRAREEAPLVPKVPPVPPETQLRLL